MRYKNTKSIIHALFAMFAHSFTMASAMEHFPSHLAIHVSRFIKEQIHDHRLAPHDVVDIETFSTQMDCQPIIAEINKSDYKIDITLRWISNNRTYTLEKKDKEWADACRDFDTMTRMNSHISGFECLSEQDQKNVINYFKQTENTTDEKAMLMSLWPDFFQEISA